MPKFLTTEEVSSLLRIPQETVRYWRYVGKGPESFRVGRRVLYDETSLQAWIAQQRAAQLEAS